MKAMESLHRTPVSLIGAQIQFPSLTGFRGTKEVGVGKVGDSGFLAQKSELDRTSIMASAMVSLGRCEGAQGPNLHHSWALSPKASQTSPKNETTVG